MRRLIGLLFLLPSLALAQGLPTPWPGQCPSDAPGSALGCFPEAATPLGTNLVFTWQSAQIPETRALQVQQILNANLPATFGATIITNGLTINPAGLSVTGSSAFLGPLTVGGTFDVTGATTLSSTLQVIGGLTSLIKARIATPDLVPLSVGSFLEIALGAASGNTYAMIQAFTNGGSSPGTLTLQPTAGNVCVAASSCSFSLFSGGTFGVAGAATLSSTLSVVGGATNRIRTRTATPDFVAGATGSFLDVTLGAASGNTYASLAAFTNGGLTVGVLALQSVAGNVCIGATSCSFNLTSAGTFGVTGATTLSGATAVNSTFTVDGSGNLALTTQTNQAGASVATLTNAPASGGTGNPKFWVPIVVNGVVGAFPVWQP